MPTLSPQYRLPLLGLLALVCVAAGALYLRREPGTVPSLPVRRVDEARLLAPDSTPGEWLTYGRDFANQRFSTLAQINRGNVARLKPSWRYSRLRVSRAPDRNESTPLAVDGLLLYSDSRNAVFALDTRTGGLVWRYQHHLGPTATCCGLVNRGLAVYGDAVYLAALDGRLVALDRRTGEKRWDTMVASPSEGYSLTMAPLAAAGMILVGPGGGDFGARGFLDAYDPRSGARRWRFWTIPSPQEGGGGAGGRRPPPTASHCRGTSDGSGVTAPATRMRGSTEGAQSGRLRRTIRTWGW